MNICILINKDLNPNTYAFVYPILINFKNFEKLTIDIVFDIKEKNYDIILIDSKFFIKQFNDNNNQEIENKFKILKQKTKILVYCDNEASIFINKNIFKFIDYYLKGRIPADLNIYKKPLYGQRQFTEFYNKKYNIIDDNENYSHILNDHEISKIILGWNNGIADYSYTSFIRKNIYKFTDIFIKTNKINFINKNKLFTARFKQNYNRNTINYHRNLYEKIFSKRCEINRISRFRYFNELKKSFFSVSPYGWGEICYRDFESFLYKCVLLKPDMSHINTWPNYYIGNKTYLPMPWDNLNDTFMEKIITNKENYIDIASEGNKNYLKYFDCNRNYYFLEHFNKIINKITE